VPYLFIAGYFVLTDVFIMLMVCVLNALNNFEVVLFFLKLYAKIDI